MFEYTVGSYVYDNNNNNNSSGIEISSTGRHLVPENVHLGFVK